MNFVLYDRNDVFTFTLEFSKLLFNLAKFVNYILYSTSKQKIGFQEVCLVFLRFYYKLQVDLFHSHFPLLSYGRLLFWFDSSIHVLSSLLVFVGYHYVLVSSLHQKEACILFLKRLSRNMSI